MELSSITDKLVQNLQRAQVESVVAVTKALGLKTGSQFLADVGKVTQASPDERTQLVKSIEANLAQLNKNSAAPAIKAVINQLVEQQKLAQTPGVKLANLTITPPATAIPVTASPVTTPTVATPTVTTSPAMRSTAATPAPIPLLTYTNLPIQSGQTLLMQLAEGQRLQVLQVLSKSEAATFTALLQANNSQGATASSPAATLSTATSLLSNTLSGASTSHLINSLNSGNAQPITAKPAVSSQALEAIGDTLRRLLPQKDKGQDLMTALPQITRFIQQLPIGERQEWLSSQLQQSLKTLANHVRAADQLSNPKLVEMALKNNGQHFEHKLAQLAIKNPETPTPANANTTTTTTPAQTNALNAGIQSSTLMQKNGLSQTAIEQKLLNIKSVDQKPIERMANQDLKGALLSVLHQLDGELETTTTLPTSLSPSSDSSKPQLANMLPQFLGMLMHKQPGELSQKQLRNQLVMLMQQYTLGSLAKIQLQQVHTLNHQITQGNDQVQPTQSWQFEIPVRTGQDVTPLHIHMEQQWVEEKAEGKTQPSTRVRQWNVMLGFDLPVIGQFYAQFSLLADQLSARFWAENEKTLAATKSKMDELKTQLEQEGIQVTQMQCIAGLPPKPKLNFSYSLVDIKT